LDARDVAAAVIALKAPTRCGRAQLALKDAFVSYKIPSPVFLLHVLESEVRYRPFCISGSMLIPTVYSLLGVMGALFADNLLNKSVVSRLLCFSSIPPPVPQSPRDPPIRSGGACISCPLLMPSNYVITYDGLLNLCPFARKAIRTETPLSAAFRFLMDPFLFIPNLDVFCRASGSHALPVKMPAFPAILAGGYPFLCLLSSV